MDPLLALLLGVLQGATEWLPVSSSGHLVLAQSFLGLQAPILFDVLLHLSTALVVVLFFRKDVVGILKALARRDLKSEYGRLLLLLVIGSVPTALLGYAFRDLFSSLFGNPAAVGAALLATGCILLATRLPAKPRPLGLRESLLIGAAQGIAIIPGLSRSGATIGTGLLSGIDRALLVRFSFLLSVPAILGASLFEASEIAQVDPLSLGLGMLASFAVGWLSLKLVIKTIMEKRFHWFSLYCFCLGGLVLALSFL
jgi:undecaprenyl-diphosphatase